jgi:hypothetical protein
VLQLCVGDCNVNTAKRVASRWKVILPAWRVTKVETVQRETQMANQGQKTKLVRVYFTREQIYQHQGVMVLKVPYDMTVEEIETLDNDDLNALPRRPLSKPEYGDETESDVVHIDSVEDDSETGSTIYGIVTANGEGEWSISVA